MYGQHGAHYIQLQLPVLQWSVSALQSTVVSHLTFAGHTLKTHLQETRHRQLHLPGLRKQLGRNFQNFKDYLLFGMSSRDDDGAVFIVREMEIHTKLLSCDMLE